VCLIAGMPLAVASGNAQGSWLEAIEKRIAVTSKMLGAMKGIKMTGLTDSVSVSVTKHRMDEIRASRRFRLYGVLVVTLCLTSLEVSWNPD
jgi:ATP-binding cassette subfamily C (CFTR/MRP) protein 1